MPLPKRTPSATRELTTSDHARRALPKHPCFHFSIYYDARVNAVLRALNTPRRREILRLIWEQELAAGDIHRSFTDVTFGAISQHLRVLEEAELVSRRVEGRQRFYRARKDALGPLAGWLESMWDSALERLALNAELEAARRGPRAKRSKAKQTRPHKRSRSER